MKNRRWEEVQELSEGWEAMLALGFEPLPCLYSGLCQVAR